MSRSNSTPTTVVPDIANSYKGGILATGPDPRIIITVRAPGIIHRSTKKPTKTVTENNSQTNDEIPEDIQVESSQVAEEIPEDIDGIVRGTPVALNTPVDSVIEEDIEAEQYESYNLSRTGSSRLFSTSFASSQGKKITNSGIDTDPLHL